MASAAQRGRRFNVSEIPPLREDPFAPDVHDAARAEWVMGLWHEQDDRLRQRDRQVEENIRMLLGQHWIVWNELLQRYVDVSEYLSDDEKKWRHMPVLNRIFLWFILTHARMTENPPVISWQPGPDRIDAELAEVIDPIMKHLWQEVGMLDVIDRLVAWLLPSGRAHLKSIIDPTMGDVIEARDTARLELLGPDGQPIRGADGQPIGREVPGVPLDAQGNPLARLGQDGELVGMDADPHMFYEGMLDVLVLSCLEVRGEPGNTPWHRQRYHIHRTLLTPEQAWETYGMELEPDVRGTDSESSSIFTRLVHGSGLFGAAGRNTGSYLEVDTNREFVTIYELWQRPGRFPGTQRRTKAEAGGRLTIVSGSKVCIRDGQRSAPFKYTSPIRCFDYARLPGRPQGTSAQEMINGPVRTRNRLAAQEIQHATLVANPVRLINQRAGIQEGQIRNIPGEEILHHAPDGVKPFEYAQAPQLGREVAEAGNRLTREIDQMASLSGAEGSPPTADASGELVKELRFNADRPISAPLRMMVTELARMCEDWRVMIPLFWDEPKIIRVAGDDNIARVITLKPHLFEEAAINAIPEIESMLPEGRGERQARVERMWEKGIWGPPDSVQARATYLELARFPHMGVATRPGGVDRSTAEQNTGALLLGAPAESIPVFEWYDFEIHLDVLHKVLKSPEFLRFDPAVQEQMVEYRTILLEAQSAALMLQAQRELAVAGPIQAATAAVATAAAGAAGAEGGAPPPTDPTVPAEGRPRSQEHKGRAVA